MNAPKNQIEPDAAPEEPPETVEAAAEDEEQSLPEADAADALPSAAEADEGSLAEGRAAIVHSAKLAPSRPGVYRMIDARGDVLYVGKAKNIRKRIAAYARIGERRWNLILDDGVTVELPEAGWQKELDALDHLIIDNGILERDITQIDLRSPTHYFFLLKSGEKKDVERGKET